MLLSSLVSFLAASVGRGPWAGRVGRGSAQPSFEGILEELFAVWPLDPEEEREVRARYRVG